MFAQDPAPTNKQMFINFIITGEDERIFIDPCFTHLRDLKRLFCLMFRLCRSPVQGAGTVPLCTLLQLSQVTEPLRPESDRLLPLFTP